MEHKLANVFDVAGKHFDFIIIGGGTAGLVLANRLSENPATEVVVLEAGNAHFDDPNVLTPDGWMQQFMNPEYDWQFKTLPQANAKGNSLTWTRGKGLGGSSAINLLAYTRPHRKEIDALESLGNPGWNWDNFYKYAKKAERFTPPVAPDVNGFKNLYTSDAVGHDGYLPISFAQTACGAELPFQTSLVENGAALVKDALSGATAGTWKGVSTLDPKSGTRVSSATAYLQPIIDRPNLTVLTDASVNKIITAKAGEDVVARGTEFEHDGKLYEVYASKEVILSASTVQSPKILELSGIGDTAILEPLGIPVQLHLPSVGTNVQDHLIHTALAYFMREDINILTTDLIHNPLSRPKALESYPDIPGPLSLLLSGLSFIPIQTFSEKAAELIENQKRTIEKNASKYPAGLKEQYDIIVDLMKDKDVGDMEIVIFPFPVTPDVTKPIVSILPSIGHPFSRGTIHISSSDPKQPPAIDPHYFEEAIDLDILVESSKFTRKVAASETFKAVIMAEASPGPEIATDEQLREHVLKNLSTTWHTCGSLSMLPRNKGGVVDHKLKVYGTKNIRVVDLSILPLIVATHTQAVVYGIAEMAADIIKEENSLL